MSVGGGPEFVTTHSANKIPRQRTRITVSDLVHMFGIDFLGFGCYYGGGLYTGKSVNMPF